MLGIAPNEVPSIVGGVGELNVTLVKLVQLLNAYPPIAVILSPISLIVGIITRDAGLVCVSLFFIALVIYYNYRNNINFKNRVNNFLGLPVIDNEQPEIELMTDEERNIYYNDALKLYNRFEDNSRD